MWNLRFILIIILNIYPICLSASEDFGSYQRSIQRAKHVNISSKYKTLISWMHEDLKKYLADFDNLFDAKLKRIKDHETTRLKENLKPFASVVPYTNAHDFQILFVGPEREKPLKNTPTASEIEKMNSPGLKMLYLDTWFVPFFNTGTQTKEEAKQGVVNAIEVFSKFDLDLPVSIYDFMYLVSLFARPEFNDIRRYKLQVFPNEDGLALFREERLDAWAIGEQFPQENFKVINYSISLDTLSFSFGMRIHFMGLTSHLSNNNYADGRHFTGPADFLEHDQSHGYFNLNPAVPGTPEEWEVVHNKFLKMQNEITDKAKRLMNSLVYFHFTHESAFKTLIEDENGILSNPQAYADELFIINKRILTLNDYDWILKRGLFESGYEDILIPSFLEVSEFFRFEFSKIQANQRLRNRMNPPSTRCNSTLNL
jgi:hypothetical protein